MPKDWPFAPLTLNWLIGPMMKKMLLAFAPLLIELLLPPVDAEGVVVPVAEGVAVLLAVLELPPVLFCPPVAGIWTPFEAQYWLTDWSQFAAVKSGI